MKKLGLIALALITVLTTLGVGFAMWQQTITVTGVVNTGKLAFTADTGTGTWVFKDVTSGAAIKVTGAVGTATTTLPTGQTVLLPASGMPVVGSDTIILVGCCYTSSIVGNAITMNWYNLFPISPFGTDGSSGSWCADFSLNNTSTIPVKFHAVVTASTGLGLLPTPIITFTSNAQEVTLEGYQIEPGSAPLHVSVCLSVPDFNTTQNQTGSFTLLIQAVQWNEFTGTTIQ